MGRRRRLSRTNRLRFAIHGGQRKLGVDDGVVHLFVEHTTCGLFINENADPDVVGDLLRRFEKLVPWHDPADRHAEGNTAAHLRSIMTGCSLTIPVAQGRLLLGTWQGIYLAEFDGPRTRRAVISTLK
ncbi:hypothetical protein BOW53_14060 [Solemya pervernicosa gill symbiont]|uniref:Secondary thiamine-phosphate synthase n=1 Tax=Solemya pervernicosa gill symbiont TaxID=642797 RepID=A0A1T2L144_9GAMM|nr:hypothetical protein BOW53_14060 [Solemya pervernicosa gill symbiont]